MASSDETRRDFGFLLVCGRARVQYAVRIGGLGGDVTVARLSVLLASMGFEPDAVSVNPLAGYGHAVFDHLVEAEGVQHRDQHHPVILDGRRLTFEVMSLSELPPPPPPAQPTPEPHFAKSERLRVGIEPLLEIGSAARAGLRVVAFRNLRYHEEYYGVCLLVAVPGGATIESHISLLHCKGCRRRLSGEQVAVVEDRRRRLVGQLATFSDSPLTLEHRGGLLHRAWGFMHVQTDFSRKELWGIRSMLSAWLPGATSAESKSNFHLSLDRVD